MARFSLPIDKQHEPLGDLQGNGQTDTGQQDDEDPQHVRQVELGGRLLHVLGTDVVRTLGRVRNAPPPERKRKPRVIFTLGYQSEGLRVKPATPGDAVVRRPKLWIGQGPSFLTNGAHQENSE